MNRNENISKLWDTAKMVMGEKFIALKAYIRKEELSQINCLSSRFNNLQKEQQNKPKASRRRKIIKIRAEIIIESIKTEKIKKQRKSLSFSFYVFEKHK